MATPRKRKPRKHSRGEKVAKSVALYLAGELPGQDEFGELSREDWRRYGKQITTAWIKERPGTRPPEWWRDSAPRADAGEFKGGQFESRIIDFRRLLSGPGEPVWQVLAYAPNHDYGVPDWYGDHANPPVFESQFEYLHRHGLLTPDEQEPETEPHPAPALFVDRADWELLQEQLETQRVTSTP